MLREGRYTIRFILGVHSNVLLSVDTHVNILDESSDVFWKLSWRCVQQFVVVLAVHPLIQILCAVNSLRDIEGIICDKKNMEFINLINYNRLLFCISITGFSFIHAPLNSSIFI